MMYHKGTILQRVNYNGIVGLGSLVKVVTDIENTRYTKVIILKGINIRNGYKNGDTVIVDINDFKLINLLLKRKTL